MSQDYLGTVQPWDHRVMGFGIVCQQCHNTVRWEDGRFNHDAMFFPIYTGKHREKWNQCVDCHNVPSSYAVFTCIDCHEHNDPQQSANDHSEVGGYSYNSNACYNCHPRGVKRMSRFSPSILLVVLLALSGALTAQASTSAGLTYLTGATAYLDIGSSAGLAVGDTVEVWRDGQLLGKMAVDYISARRATCSLEGLEFTPQIGDEIRFTPGQVHAAPATPVVERIAPLTPMWKGRVGISYMGVRTQQDYGQDFDQPAADLRLSGRRILGGAFNLEVDARVRRSYRRPVYGVSSTLSLNRVYRTYLEWMPGKSSSSIVIGRQSSPELSHISIFDGIAATVRRERWSLGVVGGTQPTSINFEPSGRILEYGAFYQRHSPVQNTTRWELALAGIATYEDSEINREYLYLQGSVSDPHYVLFATQELDFNRGWKQDYTSDAISPTATYIFGRYRFGRGFGVHAGFDNRQRVRLWIDHDVPVALFDEAFRQGYWVGVDSRLGRSWNLGVDFRGSSGGSAGTAEMISFRANWYDLRRFPVRVGARVSSFGNEYYDGLLLALDLDWEATRQLRFAAEGGMRQEDHSGFVQEDGDNNWLRLDAELALQAGWYLNLTGEWTRGGIDASDLYQTSVNYRF